MSEPFVNAHYFLTTDNRVEIQTVDEDVARLLEEVRALKTRRNTLVPIARLMPELLTTIFEIIKADSSSPVATPVFTVGWLGWMRVFQVCSHWRRVALECANLWNDILISTSESKFSLLMLERSRDAPLTLKARYAYPSKGTVRKVLGQLGRIRELFLFISPSSWKEDELAVLRNHPAYLLERMEMIFENGSPVRALPNVLFAGHTHQLRKLILKGCIIYSDFPIIESLTSLRLDSTLAWCSPFELASIVCTMPCLQHVYLSVVFEDRREDVGVHPSQGDCPPALCLSKLFLSSALLDLHELTRHISHQPLTYKHITSGGGRYSLEDFLGVLRATFCPRGHIGGRQPFRYLEIGHNRRKNTLELKAWDKMASWEHLTGEEPQLNISLAVGDEPHPWEGGSFWEIFPLEDLQSLHLSGLRIGKTAFAHFCSRLHQLEKLRISGPIAGTRKRILKLLSFESPGIQSECDSRKSVNLYFSALRELSIAGWKFYNPPRDHGGVQLLTPASLQILINTLKKRARLGAGIEILRIDQCYNLSVADVEKLKTLVLTVNWDGFVYEDKGHYN